MRGDEQLRELIAEPLERHPAHHLERSRDGLDGSWVELETELRHESDRAHGAQAVLGEPRLGVPHRPHNPPAQVLSAPVGIAELHRQGIEGQGVHGEVAPGKVRLEILVKGDRFRAAAVEVRPLAAEGGHLHRLTLREHGDGAVLDSGRDHPAEYPHDVLGPGRGGDVEILRRTLPLEQQIAHRSADQPRPVAGLAQPPEHLQHRRRKCGLGEGGGDLHQCESWRSSSARSRSRK